MGLSKALEVWEEHQMTSAEVRQDRLPLRLALCRIEVTESRSVHYLATKHDRPYQTIELRCLQHIHGIVVCLRLPFITTILLSLLGSLRQHQPLIRYTTFRPLIPLTTRLQLLIRRPPQQSPSHAFPEDDMCSRIRRLLVSLLNPTDFRDQLVCITSLYRYTGVFAVYQLREGAMAISQPTYNHDTILSCHLDRRVMPSVGSPYSLHTAGRIMNQTIEDVQNPAVQIACDENLIDPEYADDIVLVFEEEEKTRMFSDKLTKVVASLAITPVTSAVATQSTDCAARTEVTDTLLRLLICHYTTSPSNPSTQRDPAILDRLLRAVCGTNRPLGGGRFMDSEVASLAQGILPHLIRIIYTEVLAVNAEAAADGYGLRTPWQENPTGVESVSFPIFVYGELRELIVSSGKKSIAPRFFHLVYTRISALNFVEKTLVFSTVSSSFYCFESTVRIVMFVDANSCVRLERRANETSDPIVKAESSELSMTTSMESRHSDEEEDDLDDLGEYDVETVLNVLEDKPRAWATGAELDALPPGTSIEELKSAAMEAISRLVPMCQADSNLCERDLGIIHLLKTIQTYTNVQQLRLKQSPSSLDPLSTSLPRCPVAEVAALVRLSFYPEHRTAICSLGGVHALIALLRAEQSASTELNDAGCVHNCSPNDKSSHDSQASLEHHYHETSLALRRYICMALTNLTFGVAENKALICRRVANLEALLAQLESGNEELKQRKPVVDVDCAYTIGSLPIAKASIPDDLLLSKSTQLADVQPARIPGNNVSILLGTNVPEAHWVIEQRPKRMSVNCLSTEPSVENHILRIFEPDFNESKGTDKSLSLENKEIMKDTEQSVSLLDGHYQVALPWKVDWKNLPSNLNVTEKRFSYLKGRLLKDDGLLRYYTETLTTYGRKGYHSSMLSTVPEEFEELKENVDVVINWAGRMLDLCQFQQCYELTSKVIRIDPYNLSCLPIHISVLKELDKPNELYRVAYKLMNVYPSNAISWFAVGCYYLCTQRNELARRHLLKASQLDKRFGPTWLALGHAFAADGEHDQAIASYCTAAQVIQGSHIPIMYIGIEYSASNNRNLAERFVRQAYRLNSSDPFIHHELGTLAFQAQNYSEAIHHFCRAYDRACELAGQVPSSYWEPLVNNMAHTYRKLGVYDRAMGMHQIALRLVPDSPTTLAGIALVYAMTGQMTEAVDYLHRSLRVQPAGTGPSVFAATMLSWCIDLLTSKSGSGKRNLKPGKDIPDSPPQKHLPPAGAGSVPGSEKIRFKKRSPDVSATSKSSANALRLDVIYHSVPTETPSRSLDTSDEDLPYHLKEARELDLDLLKVFHDTDLLVKLYWKTGTITQKALTMAGSSVGNEAIRVALYTTDGTCYQDLVRYFKALSSYMTED
ncbi:anaphase-promoting complex subunit 6 [Clonorchis sinensis]|uniref:Anaphase-promoting complex subunit 6 n=1 Tax=Clonorchis sinensis TaxID=79923 RepID=G7YKH4_CLOSI|nr:anaphase-promoting complex subunit 6 [Clonorchis sinensis]